MTITLDRPDVRSLSDAELTELAWVTATYCGGGELSQDATAEQRRREAAKRRYAARSTGLAGEWMDAAHAQMLAAESVCCGNLVRKGSEVTDGWSLWSGTEAWARANATEELREFWDQSPRITVTQYKAQERRQREVYEDDRLDRDAAGGVRQERSGEEGARDHRERAGHPVPAAPAGAVTQGHAGGSTAARPGFPVRGGRMTTDTACLHTDDSCTHKSPTGRAIRAAAMGATEPVAMAYRAPAQVAVREPSAVIVPQRSAARRTIDGAMVLDYTRLYLSRYVAFPSAAALDLTTAWIVHASARDRDDTGIGPLIWRASPRLLVTSATRGSGKSTVLDLITILTRSRNGRMPKVTPRAIACVLGRRHETAILDEAKLILGAGNRSQELQGILLAGYTPRSNYVASKGGKDDPIPLFGPVAYAGKDELITDTGGMLGDLLDRSVIVRMRTSPRHMPEVDEDAEDDGDLLAGALAAWTSEAKGDLREAARALGAADRETGAVTDGAALRAAQICRPLRAVGMVAGGGWAERIDEACRRSEDEDMMDVLSARFGSAGAASDGDDEWGTGSVVSGEGDWDA